VLDGVELDGASGSGGYIKLDLFLQQTTIKPLWNAERPLKGVDQTDIK
jgi:hypothetical protein